MTQRVSVVLEVSIEPSLVPFLVFVGNITTAACKVSQMSELGFYFGKHTAFIVPRWVATEDREDSFTLIRLC